MLTVKMNRKPFTSEQLLDGIWNEFPTILKHDFNDWNRKIGIPVNVKESATGYQLELVVPGFEKPDFRIDLEKDLLTVSGEKKEETRENSEKWVRQEFQSRSFKRTFTIDQKIDATAIEANYVNGILLVTLPKKTEVKSETKRIEIK